MNLCSMWRKMNPSIIFHLLPPRYIILQIVQEQKALFAQIHALDSSPQKIKDLFTFIYYHFQFNSRFPNGQITVVSLYNFLGDCFPTLRLQKIAFPYLAFVMYICISFWLLVQAESSYWTQLLPFLMPLYPICVFVKLWNYFVISIVLICMPIFFTIPPSESISEEITVLECILLSNQDELSFIEGLSQFVYTSPQKCEALVEFTILYFWFRELHGTMNLAKCVALVLYLEQRNLT